MRTFVIAVMILCFAFSASAMDRVDTPNNPNAVDPSSVVLPDGGDFTVINARDVTVFDNLEDFMANLEADYFYDDFSWLDWGTIGGELTYSFGPVNGYSYTASASNGLYSVPGALSTNSSGDPLIIDFDGAPVFAVGGDFLSTDFDGIPVVELVTILLNDGTTVEMTNPQFFAGFTSTEAITQLQIITTDNWATLDSFYVGQMSGTISTVESSWDNVKSLYR